MRIAFYAPLKSPDHPVPSGDRLMARQLIQALRLGGHQVDLASDLRSYCGGSENYTQYQEVTTIAAAEVSRIAAQWRSDPPNLWFCYHPYYKSPDLIGPTLTQAFDIPYTTAESSYSFRRNLGLWAETQAEVLRGLKRAAVNICLTDRDQNGILAAAPTAQVAKLPPFIDPTPFAPAAGKGGLRFITVAMMRAGDKFESYRLLSDALRLLPVALDWRLTVIGDGAMQTETHALFAGLQPRIDWAGLCDRDTVAVLLQQAGLYLWPGYGEAYGLAYLEAQAAGLPVVAQDIAGVPEVVAHGVTGFLTPKDNATAYAAAILQLATDPVLRDRMAQAARHRVLNLHSLQSAATRLSEILSMVQR